MTEDNAVAPGTEEPPRPASLRRNTLVMASGTFVSRALGFVRNAMLAGAIGVNTIAANAYDVANKIPNALYAVIAAGVLNAVLVPQIVRAFRRPDGKRTVDRLVTLGVFGSLGLTAVLTLAAPVFVALYTQDWSAEQRQLAVGFAFWVIPQLFFYSLYTILGQVLNAREQFGPYMWAPVLNNIVSIVGLAVYLVAYGGYLADDAFVAGAEFGGWGPTQIAILAGTATLGIAAQSLILIWPLMRGGYRWKPVWTGPKGELRGVTSVAGWALGAVLLDQVGVIMATRIASSANAGGADVDIAGNAAYFNAMMLYLVPHSLVTVSLVTALATPMARHAAAKDTDALRETTVRGMRIVTVFSLWSTAVLFALAPAIVRIALPVQPNAEVMSVAYVLMGLSLGAVPLALLSVFKRVFFALEDGRAVFYIQIPVTVAWLAGMILAQDLLAREWWTAGVALTLSLSNVVGVALRAAGVRRRIGGLDGRRTASVMLRATLGAVVTGLVGWSLLRFIPAPDPDDRMGSLLVAFGALAVLIPLMGFVYWLLLRLLRVPEAGELFAPLTRRLKRTVR
ncbi:murein biosynthesis integral membrane protein MurJ [Demequina mangrovi]|uniref:Putative peptidoglycan lipid II flippase n=1 Tax=Demequina mangrovi TaxID=1043493 RepID=A0A1H7A0H2_9MICO|nr:murein biosynthesis integral membrane protein MurJ [Demequina mangrovi]SEJ57934.1 putative peptidoglycan lipid II flippase [Demequina mangrovi]